MGIGWKENCARCRMRGKGEVSVVMVSQAPVRSPNAGSDPEDLRTLFEALRNGYTASSFVREVRRLYDPNYLAFFGVRGAVESYLTHMRDC